MAGSSIVEGIGNDVLFIFTAFSIIVCVVITYYARLAVQTISRPTGNQRTSAVLTEEHVGDNLQASPAFASSNHGRSRLVEPSANSATPTASPTVAGPQHARNSASTPSQEDDSPTPSTSNTDLPEQSPQATQDTLGGEFERRSEERQDSAVSSDDDKVNIRVKFMENERSFTVDRNITVGQLKRTCFPDEVQQGRQVRLIYSGRLLQNDSASISFYDVGNYSVIHGQISDARQPRQQHQGHSEEGDLDLSRLFLPLITIILCIAWLGVANYSHLFTAMSTAILTIVTGAYAFMLYAMIS